MMNLQFCKRLRFSCSSSPFTTSSLSLSLSLLFLHKLMLNCSRNYYYVHFYFDHTIYFNSWTICFSRAGFLLVFLFYFASLSLSLSLFLLFLLLYFATDFCFKSVFNFFHRFCCLCEEHKHIQTSLMGDTSVDTSTHFLMFI